jgi:alkyl sulfatase BDS1-like metallo-beta-lactamase superfamily hydrolase
MNQKPPTAFTDVGQPELVAAVDARGQTDAIEENVYAGTAMSRRADDITETGQTHTVDGVEIEFQMAPGTEAPAEMHFYFPRYRAL